MPVDGMDPHRESAEAVRQGRPVEAQFVRQARIGKRMIWVLAVSLLLAALLMFGLFAVKMRNTAHGPGARDAAAVARLQEPASPPPVAPAR